MKKKLLLVCMALMSLMGVQAQAPVAPSVGSGTYYYIRFKNQGNVIQDMGAGVAALTKAFVPGTPAQLWRIDFGTTAGTYILTSATGRKLNYGTVANRYSAEATGTELTLVISANATYTNAYELGRNGVANRMNMSGGAGVDKQLAEYTLGDNGNPLEFVATPLMSDVNNSNYYYLHFKNGNGVIQDMGDAANVLTKASVLDLSDQLWKLDADVTPGFATLTSKTGRKLYWDATNSRYTSSSTLSTSMTMIITGNATYHNAYELGRSGVANKMNQNGGSGFDKQLAEYTAGDNNNPLEFVLAPKVSTGGNDVWYLIKGQRGPTATALWATAQADQTKISQSELSFSDYQLWKIVPSGAGFALQNKADGSYLNADAAGVINTVTTAPTKVLNITLSSYWTNAYMISSTGFNVHVGGASDYVLKNYNGNSDNCSVQLIEPSNALSTLISDALSVYNTSSTGTNPGQYSSSSKATFLTAINSAITVNVNPASTITDKSNAAVTLSAAVTAFKATVFGFKYSTVGGTTTWYALKTPGRTGTNYLKDMGLTNDIKGAAYVSSASMLWKVVDLGSGNKNIISKLSNGYIALPAPNAKTSTTAQNWTIAGLGSGQYNIYSGGTMLHLDASFNVVNWNSGINSASAWMFEEVGLTELIAAAENTYTNMSAGINPGQLTLANKAVFRTAIDDAIVVKNNASATQAQIDAAMDALIAASDAYLASTKNPFKYSTAGNETWYSIKSVGRSNKCLKDNGVASTITGIAYVANEPAIMWKIVDLGGGNLNIVSKLNSGHITVPAANSSAIPLTATAQTWTLSSLGNAQFNISGTNGGARQLHLDGSSNLVAYSGGINTASAWSFDEIPTVTCKSDFKQNEDILVSFSASATTKDWIGIYTVAQGVPAAANPAINWYYCNSGTQTSGANLATNGTITFTSGLATVGNYMVYLLANDGYTVKAQQAFTVSTATGVKDVNSKVQVTAVNRMLVITGTTEMAKAYTVTGAQVDATKALNPGIYIVKVAGKTVKVNVQ